MDGWLRKLDQFIASIYIYHCGLRLTQDQGQGQKHKKPLQGIYFLVCRGAYRALNLIALLEEHPLWHFVSFSHSMYLHPIGHCIVYSPM